MRPPLTPHQAKYYAHELQRSYANDHVGKLAGLLFDAQVESAVTDPVTVPFVVKVTRTDLHNKVHRDIVSLGKLTVLPAPLGA